MANKCPTMKNASENITTICNPKKSQSEEYWEAQEEVNKILGSDEQ